jgi:CBS domain containing-hemolysin-like protein
VTELVLVAFALLLVLACGLFVAAEFSFVTVDRATVERAAQAGDRGARGVQAALRRLSTQLSAAQVGITVTNLVIGFLAEPSIGRLIDGPLETLGLSGAAARGLSVTLALALATALTMIFGELVPKNLAIARPLATARAVQRFQRAFTAAAGPVITATNGMANAILRRLGIEPQEELRSARTAEELSSLVARSGAQGTLELETAQLLQRSLMFGERRAHDVMTPRPRMHAVHGDDTVLDVLREVRETGHSRFPVLHDDGEQVIGIVHVKDAMGVDHVRRGEVPVRDVMAAPLLVPDTIELDALLEQLQRGGLQMAVVVDEFGGVDGIVTIEDLIEEIVGEVRDEHDDPADDPIREQSDGTWSLSGLVRPDEVAAATGVALPEDEDYETVAGLIGLLLGRLPRPGDEVEVAAGDEHGRHVVATLSVARLDGLRVDRVRLRVEPAVEEEDEP